MLKQKYILFVYLIISNIHLQTQYALMFTFLSKLLCKTKTNKNTILNKTKHTNKHTYTLTHADKQKKCIRLIFIPVHKHNNFPVYS